MLFFVMITDVPSSLALFKMSGDLSRREFGKCALSSLAGVAFLQTIVSGCGAAGPTLERVSSAVAPKAAEVVRHWSMGLVEMASDLKSGRITALDWQDQVERLFGRIELQELLGFIDFERLKVQLELPDAGVSTRGVAFPRIEGIPENTSFVKKIFGMRKGRAIVPHGHSNMASAHLILSGEMMLRHYEKIGDDGDRLIVRPSIEKVVTPGDSSSISDERDNVHWFVAESDQAYTFDVIVLDLNEAQYEIHNLDMNSASKTGNGDLSVPKIDVRTALRKYGKQHHEVGSGRE
jgi:hypothetical protein